MAKEKKQTRTAEQIYLGKPKEGQVEIPVSKDKDFVLISYKDAVKLQNLNLFGIGRRMKKIVKKHKMQHGLVSLTKVEESKPVKREVILERIKEKEIVKKAEDLQELKKKNEQEKAELQKKIDERIKASEEKRASK